MLLLYKLLIKSTSFIIFLPDTNYDELKVLQTLLSGCRRLPPPPQYTQRKYLLLYTRGSAFSVARVNFLSLSIVDTNKQSGFVIT